MMVQDGITISGDRKLTRRLQTLPARVQKKIVRKAMRQGAKVIARGARSRFPRGKTGLGRKSIVVRAAKNRKRGEIKLTVAFKDWESLVEQGGQFFYPAAVEYGVPSRNIPAQAPMRRAYEQDGPQARDIVIQAIWDGIEKEAKT